MQYALLAIGVIVTGIAATFAYLNHMPGPKPTHSHIELTAAEDEIRRNLIRHVHHLASTIGGRSYTSPANLRKAAEYIHAELREAGYAPQKQTYTAEGMQFENVEAGVLKSDSPVLIIGAHYDTAGDLPGANDNGSGLAATLELARLFSKDSTELRVRWVFFANEEPPWFQTPGMGSYVYAKRCRERNENLSAMLSLETIGYYSDERGSQQYPTGFHPGYPDTGNFLGFVSDVHSATLLRDVVRLFRENASLPAEGAAAPAMVAGVGWSDHWAFWQFGYRALMVTDTAPFRYPWYHTAQDTPEKLDYVRMTKAVTGLAGIIRGLQQPDLRR